MAAAASSASSSSSAGALATLAGQLFLARVAWTAMKATDAALLGHSSTLALEAAALSDLWTQSTGVLLQGGVLGTLVGQALGAGNDHLAGAWLQVSLAVQAVLLLPVAASWCLTGVGVAALGAASRPAGMAGYYAQVLALALPGRTVFGQVSQFLGAQKIAGPAAFCAVFAACTNLLLGLPLVLGFPIPGWGGLGFAACPAVTTAVEYAQLAVLLGYFLGVKRVHEQCWPGWAPSEHVTWARVREYLKIYWPAALSIASDFWRMAAVGAFAASLGGTELAVFNASYRILWIALTFTGSVAGAMGIVLSQQIGAGSVDGAKATLRMGLTLVTGTLAVLCMLVLAVPGVLARIFSNDPAVIQLFEDSRVGLAATTALMNAAVCLERVPMALGHTKTAFYCGLAGSWLGQVPMTYLCLAFWRRDLTGLYFGVALGYALLCALLIGAISRTDWEAAADEARQRSEAGPPTPKPGTFTLGSDDDEEEMGDETSNLLDASSPL